MRLNETEIEGRLQAIDRHADPGSPYFGRLMRWRDVVWHFGIGLSDEVIFNTGRGLDVMEQRWVVASAMGGEQVVPEHAVERLKFAVQLFGHWRYHLLRWNCEHFARLVVSDEPICHQVRELPRVVADSHNRGEHPEAAEQLRSLLGARAPHLLIGESEVLRERGQAPEEGGAGRLDPMSEVSLEGA